MSFIVKNTTLPGLMDLLAPHSCRGCGRIGTPLCDRCKKYIIREHQEFEAELAQDLPDTYVVANRDGLMGKLVHDLKYKSLRDLARPMAEILAATLPEFNGAVVVVPLPTIGRHIRERGLDHTWLVARELAKIRGYKVQKLLVRAKNSVQVGSSRKERLQQAAVAYELANKAEAKPDTTYLLLDDVWTTGATMKAAMRQIKKLHPQRVAAALLAAS